ncbi:hypothetical protein [Streptomyces sp. NRRL WC-3742]|uniref:hypothetical protein n=1 Tax=Streptomyces sp. NRRL WC-3742 TaxID=1463934 RepID=UPI0004C91FFB|nr:hypothetical protein [Streptomyces sp. NRRL WC-3742]
MAETKDPQNSGTATTPLQPWEEMIKAFAASNQVDVAKREDVLAEQWISDIQVYTSTQGQINGYKDGFAVWSEWTYPGTNPAVSTIVGCKLHWETWTPSDPKDVRTNLYRFEHMADEILGPMLWGGHGNDTTSIQSFADVAQDIADLHTWATECQKKVQGWADHVDGAGDKFQGSAAGRFKEVLVGLRSEFDQLRERLGGDDHRVETHLKSGGDGLNFALYGLYDGYNTWRNKSGNLDGGTGWEVKHFKDDSLSWPWYCVHYAFSMMTYGLVPTLADSSDYGSVTWSVRDGVQPVAGSSSAFLQQIEQQAKALWNLWVAWTLDSAAIRVKANLTTSYGYAGGPLGKFSDVRMILPVDAPPKAPDTQGGGGGGGQGGGGKGGPDLKDLNNKDKNGNHTGSGGPPPPKLDLNPNKNGSHTGSGGPGSNLNLGTAGQSPLLDKDGKPVLGKDGKPMYVPPGTTVNGKGELIGPNGQPLLDANGKPRKVPPGTKVGLPDPIIPGGAFKVPPGSKRNPDGTVTLPDGTLMKDGNGNTVVLDKDTTIDKDGVVRDSGGRTVSPFDQMISDQRRAIESHLGTGSSTGGLPGLGSNWSSVGDFGSGRTTALPRIGEGIGEGFGAGVRTTGGVSGGVPTIGTGGRLSPIAAKAGAALAEEAAMARNAAAGRAAAATAAEEAALMGRGISTTGGSGAPMMPPPGGAGGGAGQGEKERQRTTWLAEDEEVWGTDSGAVTGVIGR